MIATYFDRSASASSSLSHHSVSSTLWLHLRSLEGTKGLCALLLAYPHSRISAGFGESCPRMACRTTSQSPFSLADAGGARATSGWFVRRDLCCMRR